MKIPERRAGQDQARTRSRTRSRPNQRPGPGTRQVDRIVATFAHKLLFAGEIETIHAFRLPRLFPLTPFCHFSFFI